MVCHLSLILLFVFYYYYYYHYYSVNNQIKYTKSSKNTSCISNHDHYISNHFWNYVKPSLQTESVCFLTFSVTQCIEYFLKTVSALTPNKLFTITSWIPTFKEPIHAFSTEMPSHHTITSIIRRMKGSTYPCPLDKISIICFKRCPYRRSFVTEIK